jgi:hypothetical protein
MSVITTFHPIMMNYLFWFCTFNFVFNMENWGRISWEQNQASPSMQKKTMHPLMLRDLKFLRYWWSCLACSVTFCWFALHDSWMMKLWFCCHFVSLNRNSQLFEYNHFKIISHYCFHINSSFVLSYYNTTQNMYTTYILYQ